MSSDTEYDTWYRLVDQHVERLSGLSAADLPDWNYRDAFNDDLRPRSVALFVLAEAGWTE